MRSTTAPRPVSVGVIGCGTIAPAHIASYQQLDNVRVTHLCDTVLGKARQRGNEFGIDTCTASYGDLLADPGIDLVSVCTDHASHAPIVIAALEAGKHVVCEKALAISTAQLDALERADRQSPGLVFSGILQHRFDAVYREMRALLREGCLGTLLTADLRMSCYRAADYYTADAWRGTWEHEGGSVLINQAIHFIDILAWLNDGVETVCGLWGNRTHQGCIETEDTAAAALRFANGAVGAFCATASHEVLPWEQAFTFSGSKGSISLRNGHLERVVLENRELEAQVRRRLTPPADDHAPSHIKQHYGSGHPAQIADVVSAIRSGREPFVTARQARHAVDIVLAVYASQRNGTTISIPSSVN